MEKQLLTVKETAEILKIAPGTVYNRSHPKAKNPFPFKPKRVGRALRFRRSDIYDYIDSDNDE